MVGSELFRSVLSGSFVVALAKVGGVGAVFVMQVALARLLRDSDQYGLFVWAVSLVHIMATLATLGMTKIGLKFGAEYLGREESGKYALLIDYTFRVVLVAGLIISALVYAWLLGVSGASELTPRGHVMLVAAAAICPLALGNLNGGLAQANRWFALAFVPERMLRPLLVAGGCGLAVGYFGVPLLAVEAAWVFVAATLSWVILQAVVLRFRNANVVRSSGSSGNRSCDAPDLENQWRRAAVPFFFTGLLALGMDHADVFLLGIMAGSSETGEYFVASRLASLAALPLVVVNSAFAPRFAEYGDPENRAKLQSVVMYGAHLSLWPTLAIAAIMLAFPSFFLGFFGQEYAESTLVLTILVVAQVGNVFAGSVGTLLGMTGYQKFNVYSLAVASFLNIGLNILLIPEYGAFGAGTATAMSLLLWNLAAYVFVRARLKIDPTVLASLRFRGSP